GDGSREPRQRPPPRPERGGAGADRALPSLRSGARRRRGPRPLLRRRGGLRAGLRHRRSHEPRAPRPPAPGARAVIDAIRPEVEAVTGPIARVEATGAGCISTALRIEAARGTFFLKASAGAPGDTFEAEAAGLEALRAAAPGDLGVPRVLGVR